MYQDALIWKTLFLREHALELNAQFDVDENQALREQFRDDYSKGRMLIRLLRIIFASAKLVTVPCNVSLTTWKRKETLNWHDVSFLHNFRSK